MTATAEFLLSDFIAILRENNVRVSPAESLDAGRALAHIGFDNRAFVKTMLGQVLAKTASEKAILAQCFEAYFGRHPMAPADKPLAPDMKEFETRLAWAADAVGLRDAQLFTQQGLFIRRIMEELGLASLRLDAERAEARGAHGQARALRARHDRVFAAVRAYVERAIALRTKAKGQRLREDQLSRIPLHRLEQRDYHLMRDLVRKIAERLATRLAPRKWRAQYGQIHLRQTLRHNYAHDGQLMKLIWQKKKRARPKLLVLCDVSGSVASWSKFLLSILHAMRMVIPQTRAFVFSDTSGEVTDFFAAHDVEQAIALAMRRYGHGSSDYGRALHGFAALCEREVTAQTSIIILGDGRSNYGDPGHKTLARLAARARHIFWLNPETKSLWHTGDSEMRRLGVHCTQVYMCQTLRQLEDISGYILQRSL